LTERQERAVSTANIEQPTGGLPILANTACDTLKNRVAIRRRLGLAIGLIVVIAVKTLDQGFQRTRIQKH